MCQRFSVFEKERKVQLKPDMLLTQRVRVAAPTVSIMSDPGGHFRRSHKEFVSSAHRSLERSQRDPRGNDIIK